MNSLTIFNFNNSTVRTTVIDNEPWFIAKDICDILCLTNTTEAVRAIDNDDKSILRISEGGMPVNIINESGLYSLILRSNKPEAKVFKKWVTGEVLPSIRKHGGYLTPSKIEEVLLNPDTIIRLATDLKMEREKRIELEKKVANDYPKVIFANSVEASHTSILIGELAKIIKQNGAEIGQNRLFEYLRENGYLMKQGESKNLPTQKAMEMGLFEIIERTVNNPDGSIRITKTTKVTGKGQIYFINKFPNHSFAPVAYAV